MEGDKASNRLTQIRTGTALQVLSYTPAGNITTFANVPSTRPATGIAYNQAGRLATVLSGGQQTLQYTYDAFGQRLVKVGSLTATTLSQYDRTGHLLEQTDGTGSAQVDYIYLGDRPLATFQPSNRKLYFLHDDRLGHASGGDRQHAGRQAAVWTANYEPFGYTATGAGIIAQNLRLPGQEFSSDKPALIASRHSPSGVYSARSERIGKHFATDRLPISRRSGRCRRPPRLACTTTGIALTTIGC